MPKRYNLAAERARRLEAGSIIIEGASGREYVIPPPDLLSDEQNEAFRIGTERDDVVMLGRALLGEDEYAAFVADGGSAAILFGIFTDAQGDPGESSASSRS